MFTGIDPRTGDRINQAHLAEMIGYLGPPPLYFLQRSDCYSNWFEDVGVIGKSTSFIPYFTQCPGNAPSMTPMTNCQLDQANFQKSTRFLSFR